MTVQIVGHIKPLTGIRGIAACWVALYHLLPHVSMGTILTPLIEKGYLGVDLFFILSGFVMTYVYSHISWKQAKAFLIRRFARIYPTHLTVLVLFAVAYLCHIKGFEPPEQYTLEQFLACLLLVDAWGADIGQWNFPSWSISAEWAAYLLFPITLPLLSRLNRSLYWNIATLCLIFLITLALSWGLMHTSENTSFHTAFQRFSLIRIGIAFPIGMVLCHIYQRSPTPHTVWSIGAALCTIGIGLVAYVSPFFDLVMVCLFAGLLYSLTRCTHGISTFLSNPVALYLGNISYAIYLSHLLILKLLLPYFTGMALALAYVVAVGIGASLLYHLVEIPARHYISKTPTNP